MKWVSVMLAVFGSLALQGAALATMPNPNVVPWVDHSKSIRPGVDSSPQHFAFAEIIPRGSSKYEVIWSCENGQRGSGHDAAYKIEFLGDGEVLASDEWTCHLGRSDVQFRQRREVYPARELNIAPIVDRVTGVRISARPAPPVAKDVPSYPPGTTLPPPACDKYHPECH